jgi:hypothetical protein
MPLPAPTSFPLGKIIRPAPAADAGPNLDDPARLRREWTTHRLFYNLNFLVDGSSTRHVSATEGGNDCAYPAKVSRCARTTMVAAKFSTFGRSAGDSARPEAIILGADRRRPRVQQVPESLSTSRPTGGTANPPQPICRTREQLLLCRTRRRWRRASEPGGLLTRWLPQGQTRESSALRIGEVAAHVAKLTGALCEPELRLPFVGGERRVAEAIYVIP